MEFVHSTGKEVGGEIGSSCCTLGEVTRSTPSALPLTCVVAVLITIISSDGWSSTHMLYRGLICKKDIPINIFICNFVYALNNVGTLQLMFQVNGTHSSAMVSLEALRQTSEGVQFKSLALDFANGERLILKGTVDDVVFQGVTRLR